MYPTTPVRLRNFFAGIAEYTFQARLGVADPPLVDYISDLLVRFVRNDTVNRLRSPQGRPLMEIAEMLWEAQQRVGSARREVHRHIGDFTLFWSGLYPESLREKKSPDKKDHLLDYCAQGKRAYLIASTIETDSQEVVAPADVLERLSHRFEMCAYALREIRAEWERGDDSDTPPRPFLIN
ncbi:MAG: hypothetical protein R3E01_24065 [Pirellulaceae bacterium]|nr:hypothetical protein [Planctomycetales bacterium]MCA9265672.1 hypothetical protein [Planctomycetales bacterium]